MPTSVPSHELGLDALVAQFLDQFLASRLAPARDHHPVTAFTEGERRRPADASQRSCHHRDGF
jgi:hypothetical protein